ncbi:MAG: phosphoribosyl-AMP cyclohydrolase [archaeon]|nr:phosphoribosyl-AMP cyclohydrolase [archaeon]
MNEVDIKQLKFDKTTGLIPAIAQDYRSKKVLMLAYMNEESLMKTIETGYAHYWSRSRKKLWMKGETSGNTQRVKAILIDCDKDAILLLVDQKGPACHTGHETCFYNELKTDSKFEADRNR